MSKPLTPSELEAALAALGEWSLDQGKLHRRFEFDDFIAAFSFMSQVAILAERADHHPEWWNVYNKVDVWLTTHDSGGITEKDLALARAVDARDCLG